MKKSFALFGALIAVSAHVSDDYKQYDQDIYVSAHYGNQEYDAGEATYDNK